MPITDTYILKGDTSDAVNEIEKVEKATDDLARSQQKVQGESEKTSEGIKKIGDNGGAIATLDSLTGGLATRIRDGAEATKLFNFQLKGTRTALIATGIGAFVVALGLIVAYWDDIVDFVKQTNKNLEKQIELQRSVQTSLEAQLGLLESRKKLNELQGKSNEELQRQQIEINKKIQQANELEIRGLEIQLKRLEAQQAELGLWDAIRLQVGNIFGGGAGIAEEAAKIQTERITNIEKLKAELTEAQKKAIDLDIALFNLQNPQGEGGQTREQATGINNEIAAEPLVIRAQAIADERTRIAQEEVDKINQINENAAQARLLREQILQRQLLALNAQTFGQLADIAGENTKAAKIFGAAQALINAYLGITQVFATKSTLPEPFATINKIANAAVIFKSAIDAVRNIEKVNVPGGGGGGVGGGSFPTSSAPAFNLIEGSGQNQIIDGLQNQQQPVQAFVVSREVSTRQELDRNIDRGAGL